MTRPRFIAVLWLSAACWVGCSPALNWRQVRSDDGRVQALLPCKPDQASRQVSLRVSGQDVAVALQLQGCEASGMQFTLAHMTVPEGMPMSAAMTAWRVASLAPLQPSAGEERPDEWRIQGVRGEPAPTRTRVMTTQHQAQWVWFAVGQHIYQAAVYGSHRDKGLPEAAETYFSGIKVP